MYATPINDIHVLKLLVIYSHRRSFLFTIWVDVNLRAIRSREAFTEAGRFTGRITAYLQVRLGLLSNDLFKMAFAPGLAANLLGTFVRTVSLSEELVCTSSGSTVACERYKL